MSKIIHFPSAHLAPLALLHEVLEDVENIKSLVISIEDLTGEVWTCWSHMEMRQLAFHSAVVQAKLFARILNDVARPAEEGA